MSLDGPHSNDEFEIPPMIGLHPFVLEFFEDTKLLHALPKTITSDERNLRDLILNMSKFYNILHLERKKSGQGDVSGLFGEEVHIPETSHASGKIRRAESGARINVNFLRNQGTNPARVLFFRLTQPSDQPKPEYYWTSDYFETQHGLTQEIPSEQRKTAIVLVASLDVINNNGGLIQDINDDGGLAVRQIGSHNFDQNLALAKII